MATLSQNQSLTCQYYFNRNQQMKTIKILCLLIIGFVYGAQDCGKAQLTEQQLVNLSVECFNERYSTDTHDGHKLSRIIQNRLTQYRKLLQHMKMHNRKHIQTTPVIKWAQTRQKIFINFKLSHRQDSPPCSDVRHQKFTIENVDEVNGKFEIEKNINETNSSKFYFSSECFFTDQKFLFKLNMTLNASLRSMTIDRQGFGSYTIVGEKKQAQIWIDPFDDVHRAAIWPQMRVRYESQMNQYFELREKRFEESDGKNKKKKKKRPLSKPHSQQQNKSPSEQL